MMKTKSGLGFLLAAALMAANSASGVVLINSAGEFSYNYNAA